MVRDSDMGYQKVRKVEWRNWNEMPNLTWTLVAPRCAFLASIRQPFSAKWRNVIAMKAFGQSEDWICAELRKWWPLHFPVLLDYMRGLFCWSAGLIIRSPAQELSQVRDIPSRCFQNKPSLTAVNCVLLLTGSTPQRLWRKNYVWKKLKYYILPSLPILRVELNRVELFVLIVQLIGG